MIGVKSADKVINRGNRLHDKGTFGELAECSGKQGSHLCRLGSSLSCWCGNNCPCLFAWVNNQETKQPRIDGYAESASDENCSRWPFGLKTDARWVCTDLTVCYAQIWLYAMHRSDCMVCTELWYRSSSSMHRFAFSMHRTESLQPIMLPRISCPPLSSIQPSRFKSSPIPVLRWFWPIWMFFFFLVHS